MAIYIISDLHGEYDKFLAMLKKINFSHEGNKDFMFVLGDIFDRGPKPLEILEYIVTHKNIELILGNHEQMFLDCYKSDFRQDLDIWFMNGGRVTYEALMAKGDAYINECARYLKRKELYHITNFFGKDYLLCHAGISIPNASKEMDINKVINFQGDDDWLWNRDHLLTTNWFDNFEVICGHTPTSTIDENNEPRILQRGSITYIDCGSCFTDGRLACIELFKDGWLEHYI